MSLLVPRRFGVEILSDYADPLTYLCADVHADRFDHAGPIWASATARAGTGFNPKNPRHSTEGNDAGRYAIALQQIRDDKDYVAFDSARNLCLSFGYRVDVGADYVRVVSENKSSVKTRRKHKRRAGDDFGANEKRGKPKSKTGGRHPWKGAK
jgi:hypothetical protein